MLGHIKTVREKLAKRRYRYPVVAASGVLALGIVFFVTCVPSVAAQSAAHRLPVLAAPTQGQKILVFSPHPDDETIAVGGYIAQATKNGADVRIVLVTDGNKFHKEAIRYTEFKTATGILGVKQTDLVFLGFPDGKLASEDKTLLDSSLQGQIDVYRPDTIIYPNPRDTNSDHAALGRAVGAVIDSEHLNVQEYTYVVHYRLVYPRPRKFAPNLYLLPPARLAKFDKQWLKFPLSQDIENTKEQALLTYGSQFKSPELNGLMHSFIRQNEVLAVPRS